MKYVVILGDGMADFGIPELGGKTPLQAANKPNMDFLAQHGELGMVKTVPDGIPPGSDSANLSVFGYNPQVFYTGRSPLEAVSMGINLAPDDVAFRCNLVTLSGEDKYEEKIMLDYSSDEISTEESAHLINAVNDSLGSSTHVFYPGISYRHCMVWKHGPNEFGLTPPHDILERRIGDYMPTGSEYAEIIASYMKASVDILKDHPVNLERIARGLNPATSIWIWGNGKRPSIPLFKDKYGLDGSVISAVDLIKGIGLCAGMKSIDVEGVTGNIHTNFKGKADAAIKALENGSDFVYVHVEAPDECGHRYEIENKVRSIELIDEFIVGPILAALEKYDEYKILLLPDHPTPLSLRTHTSDPVPYALYHGCPWRDSEDGSSEVCDSGQLSATVVKYDEISAKSTGVYIYDGYTLMDKLCK